MRTYAGPFDLTMDFGYRVGSEDDEPEPQVRVTMSWEHASAMVKALGPVIDSYEEQVGPVPDILAKADSLDLESQDEEEETR
jgi:hypothetical protein